MREASEKSKEPILPGFDAPISSLESEDGTLPSSSPVGQKPEKSGPAAAPVSLSPSLPCFGKGWLTRDTFGPSFDGSSPSAGLQQSLESRLVHRLAGIGSLEYALTWKHWAIASGPPICALRASTRRTSGNGCIGWPTATENDSRSGRNKTARRNNLNSKHSIGETLVDAATLTGYPTTRANDSTGDKRPENRRGGESLKTAARMMGYATPKAQRADQATVYAWGNPTLAMQAEKMLGYATPRANKLTPQSRKDFTPNLAAQAEAMIGYATPNAWNGQGSQEITHGGRRRSDDGQMGPRGALNPDLARWLQGFPVVWGSCGATATPLSRRSRRNL